MLFVLSSLVALVLHVTLGWQWSIVGGVVAGLGAHRFGWAVGSIAVGLGWMLLVLYNFSAAPAETARFVEITSGLFGNMTGATLVLTTILIGVLLGGLGGTIGALARSLAPSFGEKTPSS